MTWTEEAVTVAMCVLGTYITRALPFLVFTRNTPRYVRYLGNALPAAVFAMLVVYCVKDVSFLTGRHGLPELIGIAVTVLLHIRWRQMLISIAGGTICYMGLVQLVF